MIDKEKAQMNMKKQWIKFGIVTALYLLFLLWVKSWLGLIIVPFIFDNYITKKIRWTWWKDAEGPVRFIMSWVDALVFGRSPCRSRSTHCPSSIPRATSSGPIGTIAV